ncbi:MAG: hypothetical protein AAB576_07580 [Elusimicrobiota bacterium]
MLGLAPCAMAERYTVTDEGGFGNTGRFIEFADRFGWKSYEIKYNLKLDAAGRKVEDGSTLELTINKNDGSRWRYRCRAAADSKSMWSNVNSLYGQGLSVLTECRIDPRRFARSVDMASDLVGEPTLVFSVVVQEGKARAGVHKGFYFLAANEIESGSMNQYSNKEPDPTNLGLLFNSSAMAYPQHPYARPTLGFLR